MNPVGNRHGWRWDRLAIFFFALNVISAALFIGLVNRPVYDDSFNMRDVRLYAAGGISVGTIRRHVNAQGPTGFFFMATAVRLLGGSELRDARLAVLVCWLTLGGGILFGARYSKFPRLWYAALLATMVFPHTATATATVLTEGPAMLFGVFGCLIWVESMSWPTFSAGTALLAMAGGLSMGIAVTCRQYFLMLFPAAVLFCIYRWRERNSEVSSLWITTAFLSLTIGLIPILSLALIWKGLSSPGIISGLSYGQGMTSGVGLNLARPVVSTFYAALYLVPLTFPAVLRLWSMRRWRELSPTVAVGFLAAHFRSFLLQPGPFNSLIHAGHQIPAGEFIAFGFVATITIYNALALCMLLWDKRRDLLPVPLVCFAVLAVGFFIVEQVGVGGTAAFFDRYVLQLAPFLGIIAFVFVPRLTSTRVCALVALAAVGQLMLWRHIIGN